MPQKILLGQVWQKQDTGEDYLVTRIAQDVFSQIAILRKVGDETAPTTRVKIKKEAGGVTLPGYVYSQEEN